MSEPRYTVRDDAELCADLGIASAGWVDIFDGAIRIACCYMGTHEQNRARAEEIVDILNAHEAAAINAVLARHRDLAGANGRPEGGA